MRVPVKGKVTIEQEDGTCWVIDHADGDIIINTIYGEPSYAGAGMVLIPPGRLDVALSMRVDLNEEGKYGRFTKPTD